VLGWIPRHQLIVSRLLGEGHAAFLTKSIGVAEVCMAAWILSGIKSRLCAVLQIAVVLAMNMIEILRAPDLLLFGRWNAGFALLFVGLVYYNEFVLRKNLNRQSFS
jgi:hypothetical protein